MHTYTIQADCGENFWFMLYLPEVFKIDFFEPVKESEKVGRCTHFFRLVCDRTPTADEIFKLERLIGGRRYITSGND